MYSGHCQVLSQLRQMICPHQDEVEEEIESADEDTEESGEEVIDTVHVLDFLSM